MLTCIKPDLEPERPEPAGGAGERRPFGPKPTPTYEELVRLLALVGIERDQARADLAEARGLIEVKREAARIAREKAQYNYREAKRQHELWDHEHRQWLAAVGERQRAERERDEARRALAAAEAERERLAADLEACNSEANGLAAETTWNIDQRRAAEAARDAAQEQVAALRAVLTGCVQGMERWHDAELSMHPEAASAYRQACRALAATEQGGA